MLEIFLFEGLILVIKKRRLAVIAGFPSISGPLQELEMQGIICYYPNSSHVFTNISGDQLWKEISSKDLSKVTEPVDISASDTSTNYHETPTNSNSSFPPLLYTGTPQTATTQDSMDYKVPVSQHSAATTLYYDNSQPGSSASTDTPRTEPILASVYTDTSGLYSNMPNVPLSLLQSSGDRPPALTNSALKNHFLAFCRNKKEDLDIVDIQSEISLFYTNINANLYGTDLTSAIPTCLTEQDLKEFVLIFLPYLHSNGNSLDLDTEYFDLFCQCSILSLMTRSYDRSHGVQLHVTTCPQFPSELQTRVIQLKVFDDASLTFWHRDLDANTVLSFYFETPYITITRADLCSLEPETCVAEDIINWFCHLLNFKLRAVQSSLMFISPHDFYNLIKGCNLDGSIDRYNQNMLGNYSIIYTILAYNGHYWNIIINLNEGIVTYTDSTNHPKLLGETTKRKSSSMASLLRSFISKNFPGKEFRYVFSLSARQRYKSSSGMYAIAHMLKVYQCYRKGAFYNPLTTLVGEATCNFLRVAFLRLVRSHHESYRQGKIVWHHHRGDLDYFEDLFDVNYVLY